MGSFKANRVLYANNNVKILVYMYVTCRLWIPWKNWLTQSLLMLIQLKFPEVAIAVSYVQQVPV